MPKKSNKKRGGPKVQESNVALPSSRKGDEDECADDNMSTTQSVLSDDSSWHSLDPANGDENADVLSEQENFENNFNDCLDAALEKSAATRVNALKGIKKCLQHKYFPGFLENRKETVMDCLVKCLKKGKGEEMALAASCLCLLTVQLGADAEYLFTSTQPLLTTLLTDDASNCAARASCALSLAVSCVLCCDDPEIVKMLNDVLETIFRRGYGMGENSPGISPNDSWLICQALNAWSFMLAFAPPFQVQKHIDEHMSLLPDLLQSSDVDLRIATGQTLALMFELAREYDEEFEFEDEESLCELLKQLSTDYKKHHGKKDRREQKSQFRDIYNSVLFMTRLDLTSKHNSILNSFHLEISNCDAKTITIKRNDDSPTETIRLGKTNQLELMGWAQKRQYDVLCQVLSNGTSSHMKSNPLLREMFDLGAPTIGENSEKHTMSKQQRTFINAASCKARCKVRAKHRDKRSAATFGLMMD